MKNLKEALNISTGMYCNIHLLEIMRRTAFKAPSILSILLDSELPLSGDVAGEKGRCRQ